MEKTGGEVQQANVELESARREAAAANGEVEKARAETQRARAETEQALRSAQVQADKARAEAEQALRSAQAQTDKARAEAEQALRSAQVQADKARAEAEQAVRSAQAQAEKARADAGVEIARARAEGEKTVRRRLLKLKKAPGHRSRAASDRSTADAIERVRIDNHQSELSRAARLADAIRNLDESHGLSDVLERLVQCAGHEVDRAAVLLVKGERLAGWRLTGFGAGAAAPKSIDMDIEEAGLAGAVLQSGVAASSPADASDGQPGLPAFARDARQRHAMALPVRVGGEVVAVLYADAPRLDSPSSDARWPAVLEVLVRHASRVLEAMTVQQAVGLSLPRPVARSSHTAVPGPV